MTQLVLNLPLREAFTRADFVVGDPNIEAVTLIDVWPDWPHPNLGIVGPAGCGKTHLGRIFSRKSGAALIDAHDLSMKALADLDSQPAVLDNAELVTDFEALFHLMNRPQGLLLLCATPPGGWSGGSPDLRSRLCSLPTVDMHAPDDTVLTAILTKLFRDRHMRPEDGLMAWLLPRMDRSYDGAQRMVDTLTQAALSQNRPLNRGLAREIVETVNQLAMPLTDDAS